MGDVLICLDGQDVQRYDKEFDMFEMLGNTKYKWVISLGMLRVHGGAIRKLGRREEE